LFGIKTIEKHYFGAGGSHTSSGKTTLPLSRVTDIPSVNLE
jgi:hypothetical protein